MTPEGWVGLGTSVVLGAIAIWKALQAKDYKGALHATVDGLDDIAAKLKAQGNEHQADAVKAAVTVRAVAAGIEPFLNSVVKSRAEATPSAAPPAALLLLLLLPVLGGCANQQVEPYRISVGGMADTGDQVRPLIKSPLTPGEQALVDAWDFQRSAGHKLAEKK